jgi:glycosyltransferase involved in cell wall biosynthesis
VRFLFATHSPIFGGPHNQALRLSAPLANRGWETIVLLPEESGNAAQRLKAAGVEVVQIPLQRLRARADPFLQLRFALGFYGEVAQIRRVIRKFGIDLVVVGGLVNPHAAIAASLEGVPVVWQLLDTRAPAVLRAALMLLVNRLADVILTTGIEVAGRHPKALAFGDRLIPFFPPVDIGLFKPNQVQRVAARAELGLGEGDLVVGNVSNLNRQKGHDTFVAAAVHVRRRFPAVRFMILGTSYEHHSSYTRTLWNKAGSDGLRLGRDLIVRDPGSRVAELASAMDIFWLTSEPRSEGIPTVVEEAMALGLPVVTTDVGAVREAVHHGVTGFVTPPRRPQTIAEVTYPLLEDPTLRKRIGETARQWAVEHCDTEICADTHLKAFEMAMRHHEISAKPFLGALDHRRRAQ